MGKSLTRSEVIEQFIKIHHIDNIPKYNYDKFVYINAHTKSIITCPIHGDFEQTPDAHKTGSGCKKCWKDKYSQESAINFLKNKFIEDDGSQKYNYDKFIYYPYGEKSIITCPVHGDFEVNFQDLKRKTRKFACPKCWNENRFFTYEKLIEDFQKVHSKNGQIYSYDKVIYKGMNKKVIIACPIHGDFEQTPANHKNGSGCMKCKNENLKKPIHKTQDFINILKEIHCDSNGDPKYNYDKYLYNGYYIKSTIVCPIHGDFEQTPLNSKVSGCPKCKMNKKEEFLINLFKDYNIEYSYNDRTLIKPLEVDIVVPKFKFGVEHNGIIWHSYGKSVWKAIDNYKDLDKKRHLNKTIKIEEQGFQLFHIREDHLLCPIKKEIWKSIILNKCGISHKRNARALKIVNLSNHQDFIKQFLEENHLQGNCPSSIKLGLQDPKTGIVYSIMTFGKSRFDKKIEYELLRFCNLKYHNVRGAASKLMSAFEKYYKPDSIVSYANRDWSMGNLYKVIGFEFIRNTSPNYFYIDINLKIYPRQQVQKHKLKDFLESKNQVFNENLSEKENMINNGYRIYYDTGNLVYHKKY